MAELLAGIEHLALARWLKGSFIAYPIVNALHIMSIGALLTSVVLMDLRICGAFRSLPYAAFVALLRRVALGAFAGALVTGSLLFGQGGHLCSNAGFPRQDGTHPSRRRQFFRLHALRQRRWRAGRRDRSGRAFDAAVDFRAFRRPVHRFSLA
jgi:hypothetical protein